MLERVGFYISNCKIIHCVVFLFIFARHIQNVVSFFSLEFHTQFQCEIKKKHKQFKHHAKTPIENKVQNEWHSMCMEMSKLLLENE